MHKNDAVKVLNLQSQVRDKTNATFKLTSIMQLNSNTLYSENPNLSIIMEPHRSRRNKFKCEHVLFIVFIILIIAMLGSILHKQTKLNKKIEKLQILVPDGKANFAWVPSSNGQVPQEAIQGDIHQPVKFFTLGENLMRVK